MTLEQVSIPDRHWNEQWSEVRVFVELRNHLLDKTLKDVITIVGTTREPVAEIDYKRDSFSLGFSYFFGDSPRPIDNVLQAQNSEQSVKCT